MPSLQKLIKVAAIGGFAVAATGYHFRYIFQQRIRKTKTYKQALEILRNHEKAVLHLGEPIKEGRIIFGDKKNDIRKFSVNLKGSNTKGKLDCEVSVIEPEKPEIRKLEIIFADIPNQIFVIQENQ